MCIDITDTPVHGQWGNMTTLVVILLTKRFKKIIYLFHYLSQETRLNSQIIKGLSENSMHSSIQLEMRNAG